jgi:hypothetical protein
MKFPLVRDLAAEGFPVRLTCGVLGFTAQAFYKWCAKPCSDRDLCERSPRVAIDDHRKSRWGIGVPRGVRLSASPR